MDKNLDLKLKLLSGAPFDISGIGLAYPFTLREITEMGYGKYSQLLYIFTLNINDYIPVETQIEGFNSFDLIANSNSQTLIDTFVDGLKMIFRVDKAKFSLHYQCVFLGDYESNVLDTKNLNRNNFEQLRDIMLYTNCLDTKKKEYDPKDDKAKEIIEKFNKANEKLQKAKNSNEKPIDLSDIISAVAAKSNTISLSNAWDLTLYQLYDAYKRLDMIENYNISIQSLLHGASSDKVQLKHWSSKID
jgi:hypothetical protein